MYYIKFRLAKHVNLKYKFDECRNDLILVRVLFFLVENLIRLSSITQPFRISDYLHFDLFYLYKTIQYCTESVTMTYIFILCMVKYEMVGLFLLYRSWNLGITAIFTFIGYNEHFRHAFAFQSILMLNTQNMSAGMVNLILVQVLNKRDNNWEVFFKLY